jgi:8-oxo-dGTP pyrophosphatase MutT (NUDIX family)
MKNFEFEHNGKYYWYSRSVAVLGIVFGYQNGDSCILATKRGKLTPDFQGYWCMPCGYLDYDETTEEAIIREIFEETGIVLDVNMAKLHSIDSKKDNENDEKQNVTIRYIFSMIEPEKYPSLVKPNIDEVEEVCWIPISYIENYNWAFGHLDLIKNIFFELSHNPVCYSIEPLIKK